MELKRDRAEAIRVAYVAATRARDLLVVPACGDEPIEGWFEVLNPVLYPPEDARRRLSACARLPGVRRGERARTGAEGQTARRGFGPTRSAHAGGGRRTGRVVGSGRPCPRCRGAGAAAAPAHPRGGCGRRCRRGERAELCGVEDGARGAARKGLRAVAVSPDRYVARSLRGDEGRRRRDRRKRFGFRAAR